MSLNAIQKNDIFYMQKALNEAAKAFAKNEVPIGVIIVDANGAILARGHNLVETKKSQSYHAEILAIERAGKKIGNWRLEGCTIYVTLEPCAMCMNLILLSKINTVVFALRSKLFGFTLDKYNSFEIYKSPIFIKEGVCMEESLDLLTSFFKKQREIKSEQ